MNNISNVFVNCDLKCSAAQCTLKLFEQNACHKSDVVLSRSGINLRSSVFDVVLINPPYVVTTSDELAESQNGASLEASWAGGIDGTELLYGEVFSIKSELTECSRSAAPGCDFTK